MDDKNLITISDAAALTGLTTMTIRNYINDGKIGSQLLKVGTAKDVLHVDKREALYLVPTVISIFNQKGGVSKTTTTVLMGDYYDNKNVKTLLVDFDQQGNLSQTYYNQAIDDLSLYDYLEDRKKLKDIVRVYSDNISILPANIKLATKDTVDSMKLIHQRKGELLNFFSNYKVVVIDCPPALNSMSILAAMISNFILMPLNDDPYTFLGLKDATDTIKMAFDNNLGLKEYYAFSSKYYKSKSQLRETMRDSYKIELKKHFIEPILPYYVGFAERSVTQKNIFVSHPNVKQVKEAQVLFDYLDNLLFDKR